MSYEDTSSLLLFGRLVSPGDLVGYARSDYRSRNHREGQGRGVGLIIGS